MVKETRIVFGPSDFKRLTFVCGSCNGTYGQPINKECKIPGHCPHCKAEWWDITRQPPLAVKHVTALVDAVHYFLDSRNQPDSILSDFSLDLEIDGDQE